MKQRLVAALAATRGKRRDIPWHAIGVVFSASIIAVAAVALFRLLRGIETDRIIGALHDKSNLAITLAAMFVVAAYVNFTFYDLFALRAIGKRLPYRIAALASFCGYGIANNLGLTLFISGAVRYRIYSPLGLMLVDITKIAFMATLTYLLGNAAVLSASMVVDPGAASALDQLPALANRVIGIAGFVVIAAYLGWLALMPRVIGRSGWTLRLPDLRRTCIQIGIGMADILCSAAALYLLMPAGAEVDFASVLVLFAASAVLGFASASPGGLGVFDAAMLYSFQHLDREEMLATLLLYRFLYFIVPFAGALLTFGAREAWIQFRPPRRERPAAPE
jgi:uncharacterized membrane protein YbhN (UPF0104 family)